MEHLSLEVFDLTGSGSQYARLPEDTVITITDTSELFDKGDVWSHAFKLNAHANAHLFGSAGELHGTRLHRQFHGRRARLWVEGLPLFLGYLRLNDETEVDEKGNINVNFESGQKTFDEMLDGMNARDVPMMDDHLIGVAAWRDRTPKILVYYELLPSISGARHSQIFDITNTDGTLATRWPRYVVHSGSFEKSDGTSYSVSHSATINTDSPYDDTSPNAHPYCNVDIGYQKKDPNNEDERGYTIHKTSYKSHPGVTINKAWPNTAPCFFVMYWLRALLTHLGIHIDENQMQDVEDLRRLFMMNTLCAYDEPETAPTANGTGKNLLLRGITISREPTTYDTAESGGVITELELTQLTGASTRTGEKNDYKVVVSEVMATEEETIVGHPAYASSDCFPNVEASSIITAIQDAFGVRLLFSDDYSRVRIMVLRSVFRSQEVQELKGDILSETKTENDKRGFMMTYGVDDDTAFKLPIFDKMLAKKHETDKTGEKYVLTFSDYATAVRAASGINKHLYYTNNGNAYAVKKDKDAQRFRDFFPSLYEVAGFMDAVDGDCTGEDSSFEQVTLGFTPLIVNDANIKRSRSDNSEQTFFTFIDEDMNASSRDYGDDAKSEINGDIACGKVNIHEESASETIDVEAELYVYEKNVLHLYDNYEQNDDGIAPIETHDWGLTLGVMRGSGDDAYVNYTPDPNDREGNDTWQVMPGSNATAHSDTCDDYGREFDYNGDGYIAVTTASEAISTLQELFPNSNAPFNSVSGGYVSRARIFNIPDNTMTNHAVLMVTAYSLSGEVCTSSVLSAYVYTLYGKSTAAMKSTDAGSTGRHLIVEIDSSQGHLQTLLQLCGKAYGGDTSDVLIDNGIGSRYGRFSLKLRAEKPNPDFDSSLPENDSTNRRYLPVTDKNLRGRGLIDQFYKEYSWFIRNARTANVSVNMEPAQLRSIDKTKKVHIGDITGYIKKMQYSVSMQKGAGPVDMEILYI